MSRHFSRTALSALLFLCLRNTAGAATAKSAGPQPPNAPKHATVDTYWGEKVGDDYQYMENVADPRVATWAKGQNAYTRAWLDRHPERKAVLDRIVALTHSESPKYYDVTYENGLYFFMKDQPPKQQPSLVFFTSVSDLATERPIVDPNTIDPTGGTSIDFYFPSLDGKYVAVSLSKGGSEDGTLYFYETATAKALADTIAHVQFPTAGGSAAW